MDTHLLLAALAGGVALFLWGFVSWVVLPWHQGTYSAFADEDEVVRVLEKNAPASGMYTIPSPGCGGTADTPEAKKAAREKAMARMKSGPRVAAVVHRGPMGPMGSFTLRSVLLGVVACGLAAWLLQKTAIVTLVDRALFVALVSGVGNFSAHTTYWNWHRYPTRLTIVTLVDVAIGWFLAGLAVAWLLPHG